MMIVGMDKRKILDVDFYDLGYDDFILFMAGLKAIIHAMREITKVPDWLSEKYKEAEREFGVRSRAEDKRKLKRAEAVREMLLPDDVKLKNVDEEIKILKERLDE